MTRKTLFSFIIALQVLFLLIVAGSYYGIDMYGKEVRLKTAPIDPQDFFYGDYVRLNYKISTLNPSLWKGKEMPKPGETVHVVLQQEVDDTYKAIAVYPAAPDLEAGEIVLKGSYEYSWDEGMRILYGIERYYVPENTGKVIEDKARNGDATVVLKIAPWGQMKVSNLIMP
jgi:uncharacterized membrane-anchored protein